MFAPPTRRVIEGPMLHVPLSALHHCAAHASVPALSVRGCVAFGKMQICVGHNEFLSDPLEAKLAIGPLERQRMGRRHCLVIYEPFIHPPKMSRSKAQPQL